MRTVLKIVALLGVVLVALLVAAAITWHVPDRPVAELQARWGPPPSTFVDVGGLRVHVRDEGPRDDPNPIVLLHGTGASLHTWDGWVQVLSHDRRVVRFDLPGFGLTGPTRDGVYTIERYTETVVGVADALGLDRFVLAGNSLGGYVAWATAVLHPSRVSALVLVDAAGYPYQSQSVPLAFRMARIPVLGRALRTVMPRSLITSSLRDVYGDPSKVTDELVDRYFELATREGNRAALVARFEQTQPGALAACVGEIDVPTLILWGGRDRLIPLDSGERFEREIAGSRLVVFDALGHVPHEEDPQSTVAVVRGFLDAHDAAVVTQAADDDA
jgi:pimeloyl-ACP methyl ester carboxylesterase